jgi:hypothetical protein
MGWTVYSQVLGRKELDSGFGIQPPSPPHTTYYLPATYGWEWARYETYPTFDPQVFL